MATTNRDLRITVTPTTYLDVPAGTELVHITEGRPGYAVKDPARFLPPWARGSAFCLHDLAHYYAWVPADAVAPDVEPVKS